MAVGVSNRALVGGRRGHTSSGARQIYLSSDARPATSQLLPAGKARCPGLQPTVSQCVGVIMYGEDQGAQTGLTAVGLGLGSGL
jgi:hypothetical protein